MWRAFLSFLLLAASAPAETPSLPMPMPTAEELGRALASQNDWRAITLVLSVALFAMIAMIIFLVVRFLNASTASASAMATMASTLARMESSQSLALSRMDATLDARLGHLAVGPRQ